MNEYSHIKVLLGELNSCLENLGKTLSKIKRLAIILAKNKDDEFLPLALGQLLAQFYTAVETLLFRIAQAFENQLSANRWHKDLLEKMIIDIDGIRPRVLSSNTFDDLDELRRFRHFLRNYAQHDLKLKRLLALADDLHATFSSLQKDINNFKKFLHSLEQE